MILPAAGLQHRKWSLLVVVRPGGQQAIETKYRGHLFRSRLEARWAAMFDLCGWRWTYEPFDADGYIPDFALHGERQVLVEVKPAMSYDELVTYVPRVGGAIASHWRSDLVIVGGGIATRDDWYPSLGVLVEKGSDSGAVGSADWHRCGACSRLAFHHQEQSYASRPCGHYDGNGYLCPVALSELEELWGEAHALTRWTP